MNKKSPRPVRVNRIARKLVLRAEKRKATDAQTWGSKPLRRREYRYIARQMIAYDLETTRIRAGETPRPLYLTAFCESWQASVRIQSERHLRDFICARFLTRENNRARFVAWNGNNFDVYIVARSLLASRDYTIRPYLTRSKSLRGLRVIGRHKIRTPKGRDVFPSWEFLDGISMTGLVGTPLKTDPKFPDKKSFLSQFAPEFDWKGGPDFDHGEDFDSRNPEHVRYAERDSEGLYRGMQAIERIVRETFNMALQPTIGNLGVKLLQMNMPQGVTVWKPTFAALDAIRNTVLRGGFCFRNRRHDGPLWKYDVNQAYAAAMRDAKLPAGRCYWSPGINWRRVGVVNRYAEAYIVRLRGTHAGNKVPFYCRNMAGEPVFATVDIPETWVTSIEHRQLVAEGARLEMCEAYFWDEVFSMQEFVDRLEKLRGESPGGPSGPQGVIVKMIGNNAYGKTVERHDGLDLVMALECPEGFNSYQSEDDRLQCIWYRFAEPVMREYHQPQLGAFITAHVRMELRRAILKAPGAWLYADTDCVAFDRPVALTLDPLRYGAWKVEEAGTEFYVIEKKVYAAKDGSKKHAKGMNVKHLTVEDFKRWHGGEPPEQDQIQRSNFLAFAAGGEMFKSRRKIGQRVALQK